MREKSRVLYGITMVGLAFLGCMGLRQVTLAAAEHPAITLSKDGKSKATIVLAKSPTISAVFAAVELQDHFKKITGADFAIVTDNQEINGARILVGESKATRDIGLENESFKPQEYLIRFLPDTVVLMGRDKPKKFSRKEFDRGSPPDYWDDQGTCYAVYDFLERFCGVRWYAPTDLGMVYDAQSTLVVSGKEIRRKPAFEMRNNAQMVQSFSASAMVSDMVGALWNNPKTEDMVLFVHRMRLGGKRYLTGHSFYAYYDRFWEKDPKKPELFVGKKPKYFAQGYKDMRPPQLCYTNPDLIAQIVKDARKAFDNGADHISLVPMDISLWCKCPACQKELPMSSEEIKNRAQFSGGKSSDYIFGFVNKVARELLKTHPDKEVWTLAYSSYARYPTTPGFELSPNVLVGPCFHTRNWWCPSMKESDMRVYEPWAKHAKGRLHCVWLYHNFPALAAKGRFNCFPGFHAHLLAKQMKMFAADGVRGFYTCGLAEGVDFYVFSRMLDDPTLDVDQMLDEFFRRYYGAAGEPMKKLHQKIEDTYCDPNNYPEEVRKGDKTFHQTEEMAWGYLGTAERMTEMGAYMSEAKALAKTDVEKQRVAIFENAVWSKMLDGQKKYAYKNRFRKEVEELKRQKQLPVGRIRKINSVAEGNSSRVDWTKADPIRIFRSFEGYPTDRNVEVRILHDGAFLYFRLDDATDGTKLRESGLWHCDRWEIFLSLQRGKPYYQLGITPTGSFQDLMCGATKGKWESKLQVISSKTPEHWVLTLSLPVKSVAENGIPSGGKLYLNLIRGASGGNETLAWSPLFKYNFHQPELMGELTLE